MLLEGLTKPAPSERVFMTPVATRNTLKHFAAVALKYCEVLKYREALKF